MSQYDTLVEKIQTIHDVQKAAQLLSWDREVIMPRKATAERIQQMATVSRIAHEMFTADEIGELLQQARAELNGSDPDGTAKRLIDLVERQYTRSRLFSTEFVKRRTLIAGAAREAWVGARANNDFAAFEPHLARIIELCQESAELLGYSDEPYDALLDQYEQGMKTADVRALFAAVTQETVPLLRAIVTDGTPVDDSLLHQPYPVEQQQAFARYIATQVGYDFERGHLGTVVHPFASSLSRNDSRITSRWYPDFLNPGLFGVLHESGHAMYEQGTHPDFIRTPLARGTSLGLHESQSRSIENVIGRSRGFWQRHYAELQAAFPQQLGGHNVDAFYRAINKVQPSYIRVEADELTYNFHIILRFELEQAMLNGELAARDLPQAWASRFEQLLGIVPPDDTLGCLQDVHWSGPSFGYFPTYALGNLYGAQFYETIGAQAPEIIAALEDGDALPYVGWLRDNIHVHGAKFPPAELVQRATGQPLSHAPFVRYVTRKFSAIYGL